MKQNIQILTKNCCQDLLSFKNSEELREEYDKSKFDFNHLKFLNITTDYYIDKDLKLDVGTRANRANADFESSKRIFSELRNINHVQANDKRLWIALTHTKFFDYTKKRWEIDSDSSDDSLIDRFFFEGTSIQTRMRNSISRLWWAARLTHDPKRIDEFELTKLLWSKQDLFQGLVERKLGTYENVVKAFLQIYADNQNLTEEELRDLYKSINSIGGVKLLSALSYDEVLTQINSIADFKKIKLV